MLKIKEVRENWILTKLITRIVIILNEIRTKLAYDSYNSKSKRRDSRFRGFDSIRFLEWRLPHAWARPQVSLWREPWAVDIDYWNNLSTGGLLLWLAIALPTVYHVVRHAKITTVLFMSVTYSWPGINIIFRLHRGLFGQLLTRSVYIV